MDSDSISDLERLLGTIHFLPPRVLPLGSRPPVLSRSPAWGSVAVGVAAVACVFLLVFIFWSAVLQLPP